LPDRSVKNFEAASFQRGIARTYGLRILAGRRPPPIDPPGADRIPDGCEGAMTSIEVVTGSGISRNDWSAVFEADGLATPYQSPDWMRSVTASGRLTDATRMYVSDAGRTILPLAVSRGMMFGRSAASMPYGFGAGGLISDHAVCGDEMAFIVADVETLGVSRLSIRPNPMQWPLWKTRADDWQIVNRTSHVIDLSGGFDTYWERVISKEKRNRARKAETFGTVLERGSGPEFVERYYRLYLHWAQERSAVRGIPRPLTGLSARLREPFWRFRDTAKGMGDKLTIYIAVNKGRDVAAAILLRAGRTVADWRSASDPLRCREVLGNDFLLINMIRDACADGARHYHLGESGGVESLMKFKEQYGARTMSYGELVRRPASIRRRARVPGLKSLPVPT
jgi:uncharacterized membrane protein